MIESATTGRLLTLPHANMYFSQQTLCGLCYDKKLKHIGYGMAMHISLESMMQMIHGM